MVYYLLILGLWIKRYEFLKFGLNSDLKTSLKILFEFRLSHVALSYLLIPFRADKGCEPSDLMRSERPRSTRTRSLK
jgi:hypothetical protein